MIEAITRKVDESHRFNFVATPYVVDAVKKVYTNFMNFWTFENFQRDLASVVRTFLRIKFPKRKSNYQFSKKNKKKKEAVSDVKKQKSQRKRSLKKLEAEILKRDKGKQYIIENLVHNIFNENNNADDAHTSGK